jgi:mono/diheme cytochrome c family protein
MSANSLSVLALAALSLHFPAAAAPAIDFDRQVRPILSDNCFTCHGPDEKQRMVGLHFDTKEGAFGKAGVIVPGDSAHSKMYLRISNPNEAMRMPPVASGHKLTPAQIETIKAWIDSGANWERHWAFVAPVRAELPAVKQEAWVRTPIDRFVLAKLEKEGLAPSPEADKATLLRRVTFDLTGLPPTPDELRAFLADVSSTAYERVVDRLMSSPHYGERMAVPWLDLARYADTHGYHIDSAREMWPWRDWVIQSFNQNMPYDQFTIDQIAGDMLPNATEQQRIASGFNRNHMINFEGGAIPEEYQNEYIVDRIEATSTTWLGVTLGCARCHDHKYDPLTQKDFYSFGAFFNGIAEQGLDGYKGNAKPFLQLPSDQQTAIKKTLTEAIKQKDAELLQSQSAWERQQREMPVADVTSGLTAEYPLADSLADRLHSDSSAKLLNGKLEYVDGLTGRSADFDAEPQVSYGNIGPVSSAKPLAVAFWVKADGPSGMALLQRFDKSPKEGAGYEIALDYCAKNTCNVIVRLRDKGLASGIEVRSQRGATLEAWSHLAVSYDGSGKAKGVQVYVDGQAVGVDVIRDLPLNAAFNQGELQTGNKEWGTPLKGQLSDLRFYDRRLYASEVLELGLLGPLHKVLDVPLDRRSEAQSKWLRDYFVANVANPLEKQRKQDLATLNRGFDQLNREIPSTMVMTEMDKPRDTFVLKRGDYRTPGDKVLPNTPGVLPPLPADAPRNRLTLAKWIVDPANPLTARVAVNHFWQMYFGIGLVKTAEDFGSQGDPPANRELLDWLATDFVESKWDVKAMQRLIVTSAVYRQASKVTPELLEKDPENRLLAHGPRFRLPAEMIHDNALFVSGLINDKVGGPSVFPYQPKGLWEEMAFGGDFSAQTYTQSHGSDLYRRSIYTFWKRTVPFPGLNTFDAPDREKCSARRTITNTPLQALLLMNDPTYLEAARSLAQRDLKEAPATEQGRVSFAFRLVTERDPSSKESDVLAKLYEKERTHYETHKDAAEKLITIGESKPDAHFEPAELAAWTMVASTILNMDEAVTKN